MVKDHTINFKGFAPKPIVKLIIAVYFTLNQQNQI